MFYFKPPALYLTIALFLLAIKPTAFCQYFVSGQDPASIKWEQIKTENFQIIFPMGFENEGNRVANLLEKVYYNESKSLNHSPKKISIILHNQSALANAFVVWAPRRSEFFTQPPQDIYPQDWLEQLAIHEFRHVVQIDKINQGITKVLYFLLGEQAVGAVAGLYLPLWFLEGDAVLTETLFSRSGRGRLPEFEMPLRTQVLDQGIYSYEKEIFGSYKDFVPDHYKIGYNLVAMGRKMYGTEIWNSAINKVARQPYRVNPFSKAIKNFSGLSKWGFYCSTITELKDEWEEQAGKISYTTFDLINTQPKNVYTNYRFPQPISDSIVIAKKSGLGNIDEFVILEKTGKEKSLFIPGFNNIQKLSATSKFLVWEELSFDPRWENRVYNDIILYDLASCNRNRLTKKRWLYAPAISKDNEKIVAVEVTKDNNYSLAFINVTDGSTIKKIELPSNALPITPTWAEDGSKIVTIALGDNGKSLLMVDYHSSQIDTIIEPNFNEISQPEVADSLIYYHGTYSGIDNIYAVNIYSKRVYQVTSSRYGAFDPNISIPENTLYYSNYTGQGFDVVEMPLNLSQFKPLEEVSNHSIKLYKYAEMQEPGPISFNNDTLKWYEIQRYRKASHLFNFHSWAPAFVNVNENSLSPGISLLSQNKLSTAFTNIGYKWDYNERVGAMVGGFTYAGWYPILDFNTRIGNRASSRIDSLGNPYFFTWEEKTFNSGLTLPLNLTRGKYLRGLNSSLYLTKRIIGHNEDTPKNFTKGALNVAEGRLVFYNQLRRTARDLAPRWGQLFESSLGYVLNNSFTTTRSLFNISSRFYFPGLVKHHSLRLIGGYQRLPLGSYPFSSGLIYPRGFVRQFNSELYKISLDYRFPLLYPDLKLGPLIYLKRVKANVFYDVAKGILNDNTRYYQSFGVEITNDVHLVNFVAPFDLGGRYIYHPVYKRHLFEFIININFSGI